MTYTQHDPEKDRIQRMVQLPADRDAVWAAIGGFGALADWHPLVARVEVVDIAGTPHRHVTERDGAVSIERLEEVGAHHLSYALVDGPLPVSGHRATLSCVAEPGGGCHVFWSAVFTPQDGREALCDAVVGAFYEAGLEALQARYAG